MSVCVDAQTMFKYSLIIISSLQTPVAVLLKVLHLFYTLINLKQEMYGDKEFFEVVENWVLIFLTLVYENSFPSTINLSTSIILHIRLLDCRN